MKGLIDWKIGFVFSGIFMIASILIAYFTHSIYISIIPWFISMLFILLSKDRTLSKNKG